MIRYHVEDDINDIVRLGKLLHENYKFKLDTFSKCLVCYDDKNMFVGFVVYSIMYERSEIIDIIVDSNYRTKGYGKKMLLKVIEDVRKNDCENVTLEVKKDNQVAIDFYYSLGFKIIGCIKDYFLDLKNKKYIDGYIMELKF